MPKQKQEVPLSFKVSNSMKARIDEECEAESRAVADMAKILLAEALLIREAKRNTHKIL